MAEGAEKYQGLENALHSMHHLINKGKAKTGRDWIGKHIETECREDDEDDNRCYLGWFKGTITGSNMRMGCFVDYNAAVCGGVGVGKWCDLLNDLDTDNVGYI